MPTSLATSLAWAKEEDGYEYLRRIPAIFEDSCNSWTEELTYGYED